METEFDVILIDAPWKVSSKRPTRGTTISYPMMSDEQIVELSQELPVVIKKGFLFLWVPVSRIGKVMNILTYMSFVLKENFIWRKITEWGNERWRPGTLFLRNNELCLVLEKGKDNFAVKGKVRTEMVERLKVPSEKSSRIYEEIETLFPNGRYLEVFAHTNNLRPGLVSLGN
eukprot:snap_masked-scaffold_57-processed-gene-0.37-mRNA-1 protein AED:1.00 eAED:1.00 QI:0/-1/0/0/-1/1/1/0/172